MSAGADYIGFVFAPSKRQVTLEQAAELAKIIPTNVKKVGVFVSPSRSELLEAIEKVDLDLVQIHGQVADDLFEDLPCASIQAVQVDGNGHVPNSQADYLLLMHLSQEVVKHLTGDNWIRQNYLSRSSSQVG